MMMVATVMIFVGYRKQQLLSHEAALRALDGVEQKSLLGDALCPPEAMGPAEMGSGVVSGGLKTMDNDGQRWTMVLFFIKRWLPNSERR